MYLEKAKRLLENEYKTRFAQIVNEYQKDVINEKLKHSYQVLGAGNYILKHEPIFANINPKEKDFIQALVLLHDIARFYEIIEKEKNNPVDHGIYGAKMLSQTKEFNSPEALLAIRHHGHLIEKMYNDPEYVALSPKKQQKTKDIAFLIRDADKLANLNLLVSNFKEIEHVFFVQQSFKNPLNQTPTPIVEEDFLTMQAVKKSQTQNFADHALMIMAWLYDINYQSSFIFIEKLNIINRLFNIFSKFWTPERTKKFRTQINTYLENRK